jgi:hypothetical protein
VPNDVFDVVVRVLADAGAYWLHPDALGSDRRPGVPGVR